MVLYNQNNLRLNKKKLRNLYMLKQMEKTKQVFVYILETQSQFPN